MKHKFLPIFLCILAIFPIATNAQEGPVFRRNLPRVASMDPTKAGDVAAARAASLSYETLLEYDYTNRPYRLIPGLATALPEISSTGLVYIFHIAPAARYTPNPCFGVDASGQPKTRAVTANDFVFALKRLADHKLASPGAWLVEDNIRGMRAFAEQSSRAAASNASFNVEGLQALDDHTLRIELARPSPQLIWLLAMTYTAPMPPEAIAFYGDTISEHPVGSGPYRLVSWRRNHEMVFARNADWRGWKCGPAAVTGSGEVPFEKIIFRVMDDASTQWLAFLAGELDFQGDISRDNLDTVVDADRKLRPEFVKQGIVLTDTPTLDVFYIGLNMEDPVLGTNKLLRQALNCAFDGARWETFMKHRVVRADSPVPPGIAGRVAEPFGYNFDLARAKKMLAEAGYPEGRDPATGNRLVLNLDLGQTTPDARESAELLATFMSRIGVDVVPKYQTFPAFLQKLAARETQMFSLGWVGDYPDAENFLQLFYGRNVSPGPNHSNYRNAEFDRLYDAARAAADEATRLDCYRQMQMIVREDCPWIFLHFPRAFSLNHSRVHNYHPHDFPYGMEKYLRTPRAN